MAAQSRTKDSVTPGTPERCSEHASGGLVSTDKEGVDKNYDTDEETEDVICALDKRGLYLGCSIYTEVDKKLSLMEDIVFPGPEFISARMNLRSAKVELKLTTELVLTQINPTVLFYSSRMDDSLGDFIKGSGKCSQVYPRCCSNFSGSH